MQLPIGNICTSKEVSSIMDCIVILSVLIVKIAISVVVSNVQCHTLSCYAELTCSELKTVKSQANMVVFLLRVSTPNAHVMPSNGSRITTAFMVALYLRDATQVLVGV